MRTGKRNLLRYCKLRLNTYITKLPKKLTFGNLSDQNLMFYSGCVSYRITPEMIRKAGTEGRLLVDASGMQGALVRVSDNEGNKLAVLGWDPYVADVTEYAETGFVLTLVCTRKNTFGPLHLFTALPGLPRAMFSFKPSAFCASKLSLTAAYSA